MAETTKPRTRRTQPTRRPAATAKAEGDRSDPDVPDWIERTFFSGDGPAVPAAVAMLRAGPFAAGTGMLLDSLAQMQAEAVRFGAQRVHRVLAAQAEMLACRSAAELRAAQRAYAEGLAADYAHEWSRMFGFGMRFGLGQLVPAPPEPADAHRGTPA